MISMSYHLLRQHHQPNLYPNRVAILVVNLHFSRAIGANSPFVLTIWEYVSCVISYRGACKLSGVGCPEGTGHSFLPNRSNFTIRFPSWVGRSIFGDFSKKYFWAFFRGF